MPLQSYAPSISSHVSHGSICRLPNVHIPGYEHSEMSEFPNPATSSKQLIPLEPDFSQMSDPSVMIDPPISTDVSQTRPSRKEQSRRDHKSKKRRGHRSSSSSSSTSRSDSLNSSRGKKNSKRSKHSHKKRRRRSMMPSSSSNTSQSQIDSVDIKGLKNPPRLFKRLFPFNLRRPILFQSILNQLILMNFIRIFLKRRKNPIRRLKLKSGLLTVL